MNLDHDACYRALQTRDARFDGRFFTGVRTTGIYCRPICPARTPKSENCRFFPSAAAAQEAGFRPCLRCRPESSPDLGAWNGTSATVSRALALIEAGALDEGDLAALSDRLGVGERHLRRLFQRHLGASPVAVAQTRRVLLARQLIHETSLPMTDVALAAGFGSVRRFNETFQALYGRPPGELRRRNASSAAAGDALVLMLPYRPPYDWDAMLAFLAVRAIPGVESLEGGAYRRTIAFDGAAGSVTVEHRPDRQAVRATIRFPRLSALPGIIARIRRVFDLGADPAVIGAHLSGDARLAPLVAARPGLRVPGAWDGFEIAVRAVLGQQITVGAATRLASRLVAAYGEPLPAPEGTLTHLFPTPERLAGADIAALGMPRARGATIAGLAAAAAADPALFHPRGDLDQAVARLTSLPGIGEWTAQYIAMRGLRETDAFPAADIGLLRALAGPDGERPSSRALLAAAESWRPWRAYAALHLWNADPSPPRPARPEPGSGARHATLSETGAETWI
jgi:AraC family transcriptional regulator of adaptative response / DNA-3-methyladenine glycosylase II